MIEVTWSQLARKLGNPVVRSLKDGPGWSPASFNGTRANDNVQAISCLALDYDGKTTWNEAVAKLRGLGFSFIAHSTHSHQRVTMEHEISSDRFRVVIQLKEPIPKAEFPKLWDWAFKESDGSIDSSPKDPARFYYWPAKATPLSPFLFEEYEGTALDWQFILSQARSPVQATLTKENTRSSQGGTPYGLKALDSELALLRQAPVGERNSQLFKSAAALSELIAGGELNEFEVVNTLETVAESRGLESKEIRNTIRSGLETGRKSPRSAPEKEATLKSEPKQAKAQDSSDPFSEFGGYFPSLDELFAADLPLPEQILCGIPRGQVGMLNAITNKGKTTFVENACLQLAAGRSWYPIIPAGTPARRVVYVDHESTASEQQSDLARMCLNQIPREARRNFVPIIGPTIRGESLNLSKPAHINHLIEILLTLKPDLLVIDTVAAAFELFNENDNAEIARKIARPLKHLARGVNCAVLALHHLGKPSINENGSTEEAYSGRGASTFGGFARAVYLIRSDKSLGDGYITLSLAKAKGQRFDPVTFRLDFETRWFERVDAASVNGGRSASLSVEEIVPTNGHGFSTNQIIKMFARRAGHTRIRELIYEASDLKLIHKVGRNGLWHRFTDECPADQCDPQSELGEV